MDADDISAWIYALAQADDRDALHPVELAQRLGIEVVRSDTHGPNRGRLDDMTIRIGRRVDGSSLTWIVGHELAEYALRETGYDGEDVERRANQGAAAIIMPRAAFLRHLRHATIAEMARYYDVSCTAASLRYGEVTGQPTAVIVPTHVHIRGEAFEWGDLPGLAKAKPRDLPDGVERVRLFDAVKRVRLIVK